MNWNNQIKQQTTMNHKMDIALDMTLEAKSPAIFSYRIKLILSMKRPFHYLIVGNIHQSTHCGEHKITIDNLIKVTIDSGMIMCEKKKFLN